MRILAHDVVSFLIQDNFYPKFSIDLNISILNILSAKEVATVKKL